MKNILLISVLFFCYSCSNKKRNFTEIYYYESDYLTTISPLRCEQMESLQGLSKIRIDDDQLNKELLSIIKYKKNILNEDKVLDIRYKINVNKDVICLDYQGCFYLNGEYKGSLDIFNELLTYVEMNKHRKIIVTKELEITLPPRM